MTEALEKLAHKIQSDKNYISQTEEATKTNLILPFIQLLGYDIFDVKEVQPECSFMSGERVDFTIHTKTGCKIIIECKKLGTDLNGYWSQLFMYYVKSDSKFAILTDGQNYLFYTDTEKRNKMDKNSFAEIDITKASAKDIKILESFKKDNFNEKSIFLDALSNHIKNIIYEEVNNMLKNPPQYIVNSITKKILDKGPFTKKQIEILTKDIISSFSSNSNKVRFDVLELPKMVKYDNRKLEQDTLSAVLNMEIKKNGAILRSFKSSTNYDIHEIAYGSHNLGCWVIRTYIWESKPIITVTVKTNNKYKNIHIENASDISTYKDLIIEAYSYAFENYKTKKSSSLL